MAKDIFTDLELLTIGQALPATIVAQRQDRESGEKDKLEYIYTFTSQAYSHPYVIKTEKEIISFIQLTIPGKEQAKYQQLFTSYQNPEITLSKTRSEIMYGFPSKGIDFIFDGYSNTITRIQKFSIKPTREFAQEEGKNFHPVEDTLATEGAVYSTPVPQAGIQVTTLKANTPPILIFLLIVVIAVVIGIALLRKRLRQTK